MSKRDNNMRAYDLGRMYPTSPTCPERTYEKSACKKLTCSSLRLLFAISDHASPQHANSEMDTERRRSCVLPVRGGAQPRARRVCGGVGWAVAARAVHGDRAPARSGPADQPFGKYAANHDETEPRLGHLTAMMSPMTCTHEAHISMFISGHRAH